MQVFLLGKFVGIDAFIGAAGPDQDSLGGRCLYLSLLSEAVPRALLGKLGLAQELLGTSGGGQFLAVITTESLPDANRFLVDVTQRLGTVSGNRLRLIWSSTENLGAWSDVRKRLDEGMAKWRGWGAWEPEGLFEPFVETPVDEEEFRALYRGLPGSAAVVWNPESPILLCAGGEPQLVATHRAPSEEGEGGATAAELAARAAGRRTWGILRGDVDEFSARLGRAQTVEEYIQLSVFYRQLLAGEVQVQCTQGGFWQKLSVLYTGGDEFAVIGGWDALLPFAREIERVFHRSAESFLQEFPGPEGKTISMALVLAPSAEASVASVYAEAGRQLEIAKSSGKDSISVMGRVLDWKQLTEAAELKQTMLRLVTEFGCSPQFLGELGAFYRETDRVLPAKSARRLNEAQQRPWRLHRRLNRVLETVDERQREFHKARNAVVSAFLTRGQAQLKLKPSGRVALEWARTLQESE